jgi:type IV pilus assembly protein PilC
MSATYLYEAFTRAGEASNGSIDAESEQDAVVSLRGKGLLVTGIKESRTAGLGKTKVSFGGGKKVKLKDVAWMARNLATTQAAGLPIVRALKMLATQRSGSAIGDTMLAVHEDVVNGGALGEAFGKQEAKLGPLTTALVEAGEMSGKLDEALHKLAALTDARVRLKRKIISALAYPGVMMVLVFLIFFAMLIFVVPAFKTMYSTINGELPAITTFLLAASNFIRGHVLVEVFIIVVMVIGFKQLKKTEGFMRVKDKAMLRMPVFGSLFRLTTVARLSTTLASSLSAGVPLLDALTLSASVANNVVFSEAIERARIQVRDGKSLSAALQGETDIPEMFTQLVAIGEETGAIDELLLKYAEGIEDEVETKVEGLTSTLEPLMIVIFGAVIGVMVIALYLPLIKILNFVK